jgi:hypothetical protein
VNGEVVTGTIPYRIGSVVEMPRDQVAFDPHTHCSTGLHVATRSFAERYGSSGVVLEVHVEARDVVSVPNDASGEKVRVSRIYVAGVNESRIQEPVKWYDEDNFYGDDDDSDDWDFESFDYLGPEGAPESDFQLPPEPFSVEPVGSTPEKRKGGLFGKLFGPKKD